MRPNGIVHPQIVNSATSQKVVGKKLQAVPESEQLQINPETKPGKFRIPIGNIVYRRSGKFRG